MSNSPTWDSGRVREGWFALLAGFVCASCAAQGSVETLSSVQLAGAESVRISDLELYLGGGPCQLASGQCWTRVKVSREGAATLSDVDGSQQVVLAQEDLEQLFAVADSALFRDLTTASSWHCGNAFDSVADLTLTFEDGSERAYKGVENCVGGGAPAWAYPPARLGFSLEKVKYHYRNCAVASDGDAVGVGTAARGLCL